MEAFFITDDYGRPGLIVTDGTTYVGKPDTVAHVLRRTSSWYRRACAEGTASTSMLGMEYAHRLVEAGTGTCGGVTSAVGFGIVAPVLTWLSGGRLFSHEVPGNADSADIVCGLHTLAESPTLPADAKAGLLATELTVFELMLPSSAVPHQHH